MQNKSFQTLAEVVRTFTDHSERDALSFFNGFRILRCSYREIFEYSLQCAAFFQDQGLQKGDRILIWSPNRAEWGIVLCACALTGVVLIPLDARNTTDFVVRVGRETEAKLLFRSMTRRDPGLPIPTVYIDDFLDNLKTRTPLENLPEIRPDDLFEILYTSGTTGNPKGVVLTHRNIASNLLDILDIIPVDPTYRLLSVLPLSHALEQTAGFWTPLSSGGSVLYLNALKPSALSEAFQRDRITAMILVPRLLALLKMRIENALGEKHLSGYLRLGMAMASRLPRRLRQFYFYPVHRQFNTGFHLFVSGGSSLPRDVELFWKNLGFELIQGYGLTETSPVLTATRPGKPRLGAVGQALRSVSIRLNGDREIMAQGPNVFSGYYKNDQATRDSFEDDWFKTGDVGEIDADGFLYIRSRKKDIIVTSDGVNVYPEDIEECLDAHPDVKESCVIGVGEQEEVVHAVLLLQNRNKDVPSIVEEINTQISPEQRIESWSVWPHDEFPKTTTLKIKKPEVRKELSSIANLSPVDHSSEGTQLQQILCEMAGIPLSSLRDDAQLGRDLGMSSIGRVELISRLEEEYRIDIDDESITPNTTASELNCMIEKRVGVIQSLPFRRWTLSPCCRLIRGMFHRIVIKPALMRYCDIRCRGLENVRSLDAPLLIASNHTSHVDTAMIMNLLPGRLGRRVCPAAWKEYFDTDGNPLSIKIGKWMAWQIATIFFNIFPFPQTAGYRTSMAYAGELVDKGWNILFFPEGGRTRDGSWGEFHEGVGVLAKNMQIPILPVAVKGGEKVLPAGAGWPKRNKVQISFGQPLHIEGRSYRDISNQVYTEIKRLWDQFE
ncbi:MAG: AMP-binding protein [Candidatus Omnitrophica bacterium]|nr:AMP-binding protein [Candidatus Omnitrophota bacterium]